MRLRTTFLTLFTFIYSLILVAQAPTHATAKERTFPDYLSNSEVSIAKIYQKVIPTVVTIYTTSNAYTQQGPVQNKGLGSGVLISHDCYILTAAHVVDGSSKIIVKTQDPYYLVKSLRISPCYS